MVVSVTVLARPFFLDWGGRGSCLLLVSGTTLVRVRLSSLSLVHCFTIGGRGSDLLVIQLIGSVLMVPLGGLLPRGRSLLFKAVIEAKVIVFVFVFVFVVVVPMPLSVALGLEVARRWTVSEIIKVE